MSNGQIATLDPSRRLRDRGAPAEEHRRDVLTDEQLRRDQLTVPLEECHAAFERMSLEIRGKTARFTIFHDLSVSFPRGRRIVLLGHKGSGKSLLFELLLRERPPSRGRVHVRSRISWPIHMVQYFEPRLSIRQNLVFLSHVLGVDTHALLVAAQRLCDLRRRQMDEPVKALPIQLKRRLGLVVVLAADFDCLLFDTPVRGFQFGFEGRAAAELEATILGYDYISAISNPRHCPEGCDLAYLLYDGRIYMFEDVAEALRVFDALPVPESPGGLYPRATLADDDGPEMREEGF